MAKRLTKDEWLEARQRWEADSTMTFQSLAEKVGVSMQAVSKMAGKQQWVKAGRLDSINRAAQIKADAAEVEREVEGSTEKRPLASSIDQSTDLRAKLIQTHRAEWRKHSALYPQEAIKADFNLGKSCKITAEAISIRQKGERAAWGLDTSSEDEIVITNPRRKMISED